jgi:hypothetical protein
MLAPRSNGVQSGQVVVVERDVGGGHVLLQVSH